MELRAYQSVDAAETAALFFGAVHSVAAKDYTREQLDAWAPQDRNLAAWDESLLAHHTLVAVQKGVIVGFGDMDTQTARPFFEKRGYKTERRRRVMRGGVWLHNYAMVKPALRADPHTS